MAEIFRQKNASGIVVTNAGQAAARQRTEAATPSLGGDAGPAATVASPHSTRPLELAEVGRTGSPLDQHVLASNPSADKATLNALARTTESDLTQLALIQRAELDVDAVNRFAASKNPAVSTAAKDRLEYTPSTLIQKAEQAVTRIVHGAPTLQGTSPSSHEPARLAADRRGGHGR